MSTRWCVRRVMSGIRLGACRQNFAGNSLTAEISQVTAASAGLGDDDNILALWKKVPFNH